MTGLSYVEWMNPAMWGSLLEEDWPKVHLLPFKVLCCPSVTSLSNVEGGGLLADGQT